MTTDDAPADRRGADGGAGGDALGEGLQQPYECHLAEQFDLESAGEVRLVLALLYGDLDEKGYCFCPCHSSLGETPDDSPDCPCGWEEGRRRYAARRKAPRRLRQHGSLPEAVAALRRRDEEERTVTEWLAADPGVAATLTCDFSPEQWEGTVDGHSFYFRERNGRWRLEIDGDESAGREGTEIAAGLDDVLGEDFVAHLAYIVGTVRDHLRAETCTHAGALAFCPRCGRRMEHEVTAAPGNPGRENAEVGKLEATTMTLGQFRDRAEETSAAEPTWRPGQVAFNCLLACRPDFAEQIRGGPADPFHFDERLGEFWAVVARHWTERRR